MEKEENGLINIGVIGGSLFALLVTIFLPLVFLIVIISSVLFAGSDKMYNEEITVDFSKLDYTKKDFINRIAHGSFESYNKYNIFPSVTIAQAILESNWGKSGLTKESNNLFGVKTGDNWNGEVCTMKTKEQSSKGTISWEMANFRAYPSWKASIDDHANVLKKNAVYTNHGVFSAKTNSDQIQAIKNAGYATDINYVSLIMSLIDTYGLERFDKQVIEVERNDLIKTGRSIVNKVGYFWGGTSSPGINPHWGIPTLVTAAGSRTTGTYQPYGLDCSGYVDWVYKTVGEEGILLAPTGVQIERSFPISEDELQPGDLGFQNVAPNSSENHVGLYVSGKGNNKVFMHSQGGTGVIENKTKSFSYWRRPVFVIFKGE